MSKTITNQTTNAILKLFYDSGVYSYRQNSTGIPLPGGGFRYAAKTGLPDIVAILSPNGKYCGVEVKTGKDRLRPEQIGTLANIKRVGGIGIVVKDFQDFILQWMNILLNNDEVNNSIDKHVRSTRKII